MTTGSPEMAVPGDWFRQPWMYVAAAALLLYVGARAAADALQSSIRPMRLAWANWMPIAAVALLAAAEGEATTGVAIVLATSVACLSLVPGATLVQQAHRPPAARSVTGVLLPAAVLLLFLAGVRGRFTLFHAAALLLVGGAVAFAARGAGDHVSYTTDRATQRFSPARAGQLLLSVAIAIAGAVVAIYAGRRAAQASSWASLSLITAVLIAPLLILPLLGVSADLAARGQGAFALEAQQRVVLLNLCLLLPLVIIEAHTGLLARGLTAVRPARPSQPFSLATTGPSTAPATAPTTFPTAAPSSDDDAPAWPKTVLPFPLGLWRVDAVALVILAMVVLPVAQGRWSLSRVDGLGLIFGYVAYLLLTLLTQLDLPPIDDIFRLLLHLPPHVG